MEEDPVCGMEVDPATARDKSEFQGRTYYFCAHRCCQEFEAGPEKYLAPDYRPSTPLGQVLDQLVAKGAITADQATSVTNARAAAWKNHRPPAGSPAHSGSGAMPMLQAGSPLGQVLSDLVFKGAITPEQATAIREGLASWMQDHGPPLRSNPAGSWETMSGET